jgi:hypothetical protein
MDNKQKSILLFLCGCIPLRLYLVYLAKNRPEYLPLLGKLAFLIGFGFLYLYFTGKRQTGAEVFGQKIWWTKERIIFGLIYLLFAIHAIKGDKFAWKILLLDPIFGLIIFLLHHKLI